MRIAGIYIMLDACLQPRHAFQEMRNDRSRFIFFFAEGRGADQLFE